MGKKAQIIMLPKNKHLGFLPALLPFHFSLFLPFAFRPVLKESCKFCFGR